MSALMLLSPPITSCTAATPGPSPSGSSCWTRSALHQPGRADRGHSDARMMGAESAPTAAKRRPFPALTPFPRHQGHNGVFDVAMLPEVRKSRQHGHHRLIVRTVSGSTTTGRSS